MLGRDASCQIVLAHPSISRRHALVALREGAYEAEDLSINGLFVNGTPVDTHRLANGDTMVLGADPEHPITGRNRQTHRGRPPIFDQPSSRRRRDRAEYGRARPEKGRRRRSRRGRSR